MSTSSYKCPNCNGGLLFDPAGQDFKCEYCLSRFTQAQMEEMNAASAKSTTAEEATGQAPTGDEAMMLYSCPSCGAEVTADTTTAATMCYYCHNPVVLVGQLDGAYRPSKIVPFKISRDMAVETFLKWVRRKWFVPKGFFSKQQIDTITGVYFPYWLVDSDMHGELHASATKVRKWRTGNTEHTETSHYRILRRGKIHLEDVTKNALDKEMSKLSAGVQPFDSKDVIDYMPAYLSGFMAEKRNIEKAQCEQDVLREIHSHSAQVLRNSVQGYHSVTVNNFAPHDLRVNWDYAMLPVWTLTYKGRDNKTYFYTMNGQTGKVTGVLPLDSKKLTGVMAGISAALSVIVGLVVLGGMFL